MAKARVVLKGSKTYKVGNRKYIKDVPVVLKNSMEIELVQSNGYFRVDILESKKKKLKPAKSEGSSKKKKKKNNKKTLKKKTSKKKVIK